MAGVIEELRRLNADVISLQEVDVGCDRSGGVGTGRQRVGEEPCWPAAEA